jgi:hypothetical protein
MIPVSQESLFICLSYEKKGRQERERRHKRERGREREDRGLGGKAGGKERERCQLLAKDTPVGTGSAVSCCFSRNSQMRTLPSSEHEINCLSEQKTSDTKTGHQGRPNTICSEKNHWSLLLLSFSSWR